MKTKVMAHDITIKFVAEILDEDDDGQIQQLNGRSDYDNKMVEIAVFSTTDPENIIRHSLAQCYIIWKHEIKHILDGIGGHDLFTDDDPEIDKGKEDGLDNLIEMEAQMELENGMIDSKWLARFNRARLRPKKSDLTFGDTSSVGKGQSDNFKKKIRPTRKKWPKGG